MATMEIAILIIIGTPDLRFTCLRHAKKRCITRIIKP